MLADPLTLNINGVDVSMPRTSVGINQTIYTSADGIDLIYTKQNASSKRKRHEFRVVQNKVAADPISAQNQALSASVYLVVDEPVYGFTPAELDYLFGGLVKLLAGVALSSPTYANLNAVIGGQM